MKPYYEQGGIAIYHGDAWAILPELEAELVLSDPPYGVNLNTSYASTSRGNKTAAHDYPRVHGDDKPFDPTALLRFPNVVLWGANYYADRLPPQGQWLVWDKRDGIGYNDQADCELAWTRGTSGTVPRIYRHLWNGMLKDSERDQRRVHPTQKPLALMRWCLNFFPARGDDPRPVYGEWDDAASGERPRAQGHRYRDRRALLRDRGQAARAGSARAVTA